MGHRVDERYVITEQERELFERDGYVHLPGVLSEAEVAELDHVYDAFMRGEVEVEGRDLYDMVTGDFGGDPANFVLFNVMLPRKYHPGWQGNIFERVSQTIADQLCGDGMVLDFDQLLAKQPGRKDAVFAWHQDQAYWINTDDRRTATCWLAVDDSTLENGCMQFLAGSHTEPVRPHRPAGESREEQHTLVTDLLAGDQMTPVEIRRGDITVHNEGVLHGSGGNSSPSSFRRAYINAYRSIETVQTERSLGFTHSHNDDQELLSRVDGILAQE